MSSADPALSTPTRRGTVRGPSRRVQLPWLAAAAALAVLVALVVLWGFGRASERREVLSISQPVPAGQPIPASAIDYTMVAVDSSANRLFSSAQVDQVVGLLAQVDLEPGDLLGPAMVSGRPALPDGWVEIGAVLRVGRYPTSLVTGDRMWAIPNESDSTTPRDVIVIDHDRGNDEPTVVLGVAAENAAEVAQWAASDRLVLIRQPESSAGVATGG